MSCDNLESIVLQARTTYHQPLFKTQTYTHHIAQPVAAPIAQPMAAPFASHLAYGYHGAPFGWNAAHFGLLPQASVVPAVAAPEA